MNKFFLKALLIVSCLSSANAADARLLVLEGDVADKYALPNTNDNAYEHVAVVIDQGSGLITSIEKDQSIIDELKTEAQSSVSSTDFIALKKGNDWDVIYPGMIDLHNHTKQNNLGVWKEAHGQFENRFVWRAWSNYKKSVSNNMNPWIGYGKAINCSAFRWSEIQAMVVGTTYLQGPSSCVDNFAIGQVEDPASFPHSEKEGIQAPTDLVIPADMVFVWQVLRPKMEPYIKNGRIAYQKTYEQALAETINEFCYTEKFLVEEKPFGKAFTAEDTLADDGITALKTKENLESFCNKKVPVEELPRKFVRYIYWTHKSVAGKKKYAAEIAKGKGSAIIAHLAEGRRDDAYNKKEYELVKILGMNKKHVNFVHAVGVTESGLQDMADNDMGIIWSPFSNLLLYNQTLDVKMAMEKGVILAMGSDWLPTGSKGPLEELKIAREYLEAQGLIKDIESLSGKGIDETLFEMVTENPAKMINHWQNGADDSKWQNGEDKGGVGTITQNAMGSVFVASKLDDNPFTNLTSKDKVWETDINLVVVNGKVQYGNESYVKVVTDAYEPMSSNDEHGMISLANDRDVPVLFESNPKPSKSEEFSFLVELTTYLSGKIADVRAQVGCDFGNIEKVFVHQNTVEDESDLKDFLAESGLNLDRFKAIQRLLGVNMVTQSRNRNDSEKGDKDFVVDQFTPLYTCNDDYHLARVKDFVGKDWPEDTKNRPTEISSKAERLAKEYAE